MIDLIPQFPTIAAIDPSAVITIVIILISIIGWLVNYLNEKAREVQPRRVNPQQQQPRQPRVDAERPRDDKFQAEIDQFLQEVGGRNKPNQQRRQEPEPIEIEVVPDYEIAERERGDRGTRKLSSIEDRHIAPTTSSFSTSFQDQIAANARATAADQVRRETRDLSERVAPAADSQGDAYNRGTAGRSSNASQPIDPREIVDLLRDPRGVRKAILVNEILRRRTPR